jgi:hypothetical protein
MPVVGAVFSPASGRDCNKNGVDDPAHLAGVGEHGR